jgi:hypothetical protein
VDVIADRILELRTENGSIEVLVTVGRPAPDPRGDWMSQYEIRFGETPRQMAMHGIDSMQALQLTIATLDVELQHGAKRLKGKLYYLDEPFISIFESGGLQPTRV